MNGIQQLIRMVFPNQCSNCGDLVEENHSLCGKCWSNVPFIDGLACCLCGVPLLGIESDEAAVCDECYIQPRLWQEGRSVFIYSGLGRQLVLKLKHADRSDLVPTLSEYMARKAVGMVASTTIVLNVPAHWRRRLIRKYDQAELLADALARSLKLEFKPGVLKRVKMTVPQKSMTVQERMENVKNAFLVPKSKAHLVSGRDVLLVDDVLTSGATMTEATKVLLSAGVRQVHVLTLARVAKEI